MSTARPEIVTPAEWRAARDALLVKEKAHTRARDALAAERRRMPMIRVEKDYRFTAPGEAGWWHREPRGAFCPAFALRDGRLVVAPG